MTFQQAATQLPTQVQGLRSARLLSVPSIERIVDRLGVLLLLGMGLVMGGATVLTGA